MRFLRGGQWEAGIIENLILTRCKGVLHKEYEVMLENGDDRVAGTLCRSVMVIASMHDEARLGNDL